jgi:hypothetical protein
MWVDGTQKKDAFYTYITKAVFATVPLAGKKIQNIKT